MDDTLLSGPSESLVQEVLLVLQQKLQQRRLQIVPEKIQMEAPWKYLGWKILQQSIKPQNVAITVKIRMLNDVQKLIGNTDQLYNQILAPLFELLKGDMDTNVPRKMTNVARIALSNVEENFQPNNAKHMQKIYPFSSTYTTRIHNL